ncbi:MAG: lyase family protein, partial [Actinomycetota bacterium]
MAQLWKGETEKAIENFPISGERMPTEVVRMLARVKAEAARVNAELGLLDADQAERIAAAADAVAAGEHDDQFPIDVFQTGSGTSTNTNVNEVISTLAGEDVHPNDHVNMGQSSNDVIPTAIHLAALISMQRDLLPALEKLQRALEEKAREFDDVIKTGRTHLQDATPIRLGQEFEGYAGQIERGITRVHKAMDELAEVALGGTAVGTGVNTHPEFAQRVTERLSARFGVEVRETENHFQAQSAMDGTVFASGALKTV